MADCNITRRSYSRYVSDKGEIIGKTKISKRVYNIEDTWTFPIGVQYIKVPSAEKFQSDFYLNGTKVIF